MFKHLIHVILERMGLGITRLRDPYREIAILTKASPVRSIVDGGAYRGTMTLKLAELFPSATIHAFEPQQESFGILKNRVGHLPRVRLHPIALSDNDGEQEFFANDTAYMSSLLPIEISEPQSVDKRTVRVRKLDSVLAECNEVGVDVIKLDLQGNELAALRGAERALAGCRALLVEVNFQPRYSGACSFEELAGFIGQHGFRLHRFYEIATAANNGWMNADALFLRP